MPYQERQNRHDKEEPDIQISSQLPLADGLAHMVDLLDDIDYQPTLPKFKLANRKINDVLGITSRCIVVSSTSSDGNQVAIKGVQDHRGTASPDTLEKEIMVLEKAKGGINLPQLTGYTANFLEFSFTPVGEGLSPLKVNAMPGSLPSIMDGICDGLNFIHSQDIIHRDIRWDNIILVDKNRPVIIDFNSATTANVPVHFSGGYICCPPEVLELGSATLEYTPIPAHDWKAYVLLLHSAIFPRLYKNFVVCWVLNKDSEESKALRQLWTSLGASTIWKRGLEAAEAANIDDELRLWVRDFLTIFPDAEQRLQNLFASVRVRPEEVVSTG
ncbi:hypothetical protein BDN72DRAFT_287559 [Pluteus cervinus]|uniref:Uncharacterized protein n=1 Tax=Pluteus cervinus TaxID=181527 RepID=A0ACD3AF37_9AGAR|nr:hypothetical protein BDN72DRAFT_287559 [Pluteus cervinus]